MEKVFSTKSRKRLHQIYLPYRKEVVYIRYARVRKRTRPIKRGSRTTKQRSRTGGERGSRTTKQRSRTEGSERVGQRNKEAVQRGARESDNETKKPYSKTKRAGQGSEGVEHPLTFGYYVNIQISNLRKERREGWNWNE